MLMICLVLFAHSPGPVSHGRGTGDVKRKDGDFRPCAPAIEERETQGMFMAILL